MNGGVLCSMIVGWGLMADGSECILDYDDDLVAACVWDELQETLELQQWALVDTEIPFRGVQHGVDFTVPKRMLKQYRSKGQHRRASALKLELQGHLHQVSKLCETCPLRGAVVDGTRWLWDCPELNSRLNLGLVCGSPCADKKARKTVSGNVALSRNCGHTTHAPKSCSCLLKVFLLMIGPLIIPLICILEVMLAEGHFNFQLTQGSGELPLLLLWSNGVLSHPVGRQLGALLPT